jgi:hypothetical protein
VLALSGYDTTLVTSSNTMAQVSALATTAAANAAGGLLQLVAAIARNIAWFGAGSTAYFPTPSPGADGLPLTTE